MIEFTFDDDLQARISYIDDTERADRRVIGRSIATLHYTHPAQDIAIVWSHHPSLGTAYSATSSCAGRLLHDGGEYSLFSDHYVSPEEAAELITGAINAMRQLEVVRAREAS